MRRRATVSRTREPPCRRIQFAFPLDDDGLGRRLVAAPLRDLRVDARGRVYRLLLPGARFVELRLQDDHVHARERLAGGHEVAFVDEHRGDTPRQLGRDVDLGRFDTAVAAHEAGIGLAVTPARPSVIRDGDREHGDACPDQKRALEDFHRGESGFVDALFGGAAAASLSCVAPPSAP